MAKKLSARGEGAMVERLPQHRHCHYCSKAIPFERQYCDEKCESEHKSVRRAKKRQLTFFYILMVLIFIFAMVLSFT